jgi:hypothetical protein
MFFVPANAVLNVTAKFKVSVVPLMLTELWANETEHWLFCNVAPLDNGLDIHVAAASFTRYMVADERL